MTPANEAALDAFIKLIAEKGFADVALRDVAEAAGLAPEVRHLANSAAALTRPSARLDLVRCGLAAYGLSPVPQLHTSAELGLVPAMTARAQVAVAKRVPAGSGVSYGHTYVTERETTLAVLPVGYAEGILRSASSTARVIRAGTPTSTEPGGTRSPSGTTAPAATTLPAPMWTPFSRTLPMPMRHSSSIVQPCRTTRCPIPTRAPTVAGTPAST